MDQRGKRSFSRFLYVFIVIIAVAFGVLAWAGAHMQKVNPVDNVAQPQ
jgi:hypothetical protein